VFEEVASGGRWDRPELHRMLDHLREGDTVVVWKLDRLSRSLKDVLHIMERIAQAGAGLPRLTMSHISCGVISCQGTFSCPPMILFR
jgi:DNA invertase Pin-like site-specific DNA recombinase